MAASLKTKYTTVAVDIDDASVPDNYFGYMSVTFEFKVPNASFFMETFEHYLMDNIKKTLEAVPNLMVEKEIRWQDGAILIDLPSTRSKIYATDVYKIVMEAEKQFHARTGL